MKRLASLSSCLFLVLAAAACSTTPATSVQVIIDADQSIRDSTDLLEVEVGGRMVGLTGWAPVLTENASGPIAWPVRISVAPFGELTDREFQVVATATGGGSFVAAVSGESGYVMGETRELRLTLRASCGGIRCDAAASLTCERGACVSNVVDPSDLLPYAEGDAGVPAPEDAGPADTGPGDTSVMTDAGDIDTDGDGLLDSEEGRADARDTDGDSIQDYRDLDSDGDGVSDAREVEAGTSPIRVDTDSDGANDMVELALGSDPSSRSDNPDVRGLTVIVSPEGVAPTPSTTLIDEAAPTRPLDVYFLIESTGSMGASLTAVQDSLTTGTTGSCSGGIIGAIRCRRSDLQTGVGIFGDYPVGSYGSPGRDLPYQHLKDVNANDMASRVAVNGIALGIGNDGPEAHLSALHAISTGDGLHTYLAPRTGCPMGRGYPCFRPNSVPVVVMVTDSPMHDFPAGGADYSAAVLGFTPPSYADTIAAMNTAAIRFVGLDVSTGTLVINPLRRVANDTDSADRAGFPWARQVTNAGLAEAVAELVRLAAQLTVSARVVDTDPEGPDAARAFIDRVVARTTAAGSCATGLMTEDRMGIDDDSFPETFFEVPEGQTLCWDVLAKTNTAVPEAEMPQIFQLAVELADERLTLLARRPITVIVPPLDPGGV